ncbi:MAG TPA: hypothetical protein VE782_17635 [Myxococcaceae bacterium]|jgi:hypothetical protein|nr:hypothetical protein [Myxococcaceae bacterium]
MKLKTALLAVASLTVFGCGLDGTNHKFDSGTYAVSGATLASSTDQCGLLPDYQSSGKTIDIGVSGTVVTFYNDSAASDMKPTATLDQNVLTKLAEANYDVAYGSSCVVNVRRDVSGDVTGDNTASLTLSFTASTSAGTCDPSITSFAALPCSSSYNFTATKK